MNFNSVRFSAKRILVVLMILFFCSKSMHAVNPLAVLRNNTISLSTAKNIGYGLGTLCSICLFGTCLDKWENAITQLKLSRRNTLGNLPKNASCILWGAATVGCSAAGCFAFSRLLANTVPDAMLNSNTISMAAAKSAGFATLTALFCYLTLARFFKQGEDKVDKLLGRAGPALACNIATGGAAFLSLANALNCIKLMAGKVNS